MAMEHHNKILIIDDDEDILSSVREMLDSEYTVETATTGTEGLRKSREHFPDLVILDVKLDDMSGLEVCNRLRSDSLTRHIPVLVFSRYGEVTNKVGAFSAGADDFVEKPVVPEEMLARVKAKLRRSRESGRSGVLRCGNLELDPQRQEATISGRPVSFSQIEFKLLSLFIVNKDKILDRKMILESIWGGVNVNERTIDAHLVSVRKKLIGFDHELRSIYGSGFILKPKRH